MDRVQTVDSTYVEIRGAGKPADEMARAKTENDLKAATDKKPAADRSSTDKKPEKAEAKPSREQTPVPSAPKADKIQMEQPDGKGKGEKQ